MNAHVRNCASGMIAFAAASAAFPVCAFADEGAGINAILPQMEEFIPMLVAFIILWIVLAKFGWPLFEGMLNKREETIKNSLEKSEEARQESERLLAEYREQLEGAKPRLSRSSTMPSSPVTLSKRRSPLRLRLRQMPLSTRLVRKSSRRRKMPSRSFRLPWRILLLPLHLA